MRHLFIVTAVIELGAGLALMISPSQAATLLLGSPLDTAASVTVGRLAGAALLSLAVACWRARDAHPGRAATGLIMAMLLYNSAAAIILGFFAMGNPIGVGPWITGVMHSAMAVWCAACLRIKPA